MGRNQVHAVNRNERKVLTVCLALRNYHMQLFFPKLIDKNLSDMTTVLIKMCKESKWIRRN